MKKAAAAAAGALMLAYVIMTSMSAANGISSPAGAPTEASGALYLMRDVNDRVVVFRGGEVYISTDTQVSSLPKSDREKLEKGINIYSEKELKSLMEDICS